MKLFPVRKWFRACPPTRGRRASARLSLEVLEDRTVPSTFSWVGGDALQPTWWSRPNNWSPMGVPGPGDDVSIANPTWECVQTVPNNEINNLSVSGNSTLNTGLQGLIVDGDATIGDSTLNGGTLTLGGTGTLTGTVSWIGADSPPAGPGRGPTRAPLTSAVPEPPT